MTPKRDLFLISALFLFLELTFIRWFPAQVLFLTFFTNTVLLASFLGLSLGCLAVVGRPGTRGTPCRSPWCCWWQESSRRQLWSHCVWRSRTFSTSARTR